MCHFDFPCVARSPEQAGGGTRHWLAGARVLFGVFARSNGIANLRFEPASAAQNRPKGQSGGPAKPRLAQADAGNGGASLGYAADRNRHSRNAIQPMILSRFDPQISRQ